MSETPALGAERTLFGGAVVVLIHQGGFQNGINLPPDTFNASDINGCLGDLKNVDGTDSDIRKIVAQLVIERCKRHHKSHCSQTQGETRRP